MRQILKQRALINLLFKDKLEDLYETIKMTLDNSDKKIKELEKESSELSRISDELKKKIDSLESSIGELENEENNYAELLDNKYFQGRLQQERKELKDLMVLKNKLKERKAQSFSKNFLNVDVDTWGLTASLNSVSKTFPDSLEGVIILKTIGDFRKLKNLINKESIKGVEAGLLDIKKRFFELDEEGSEKLTAYFNINTDDLNEKYKKLEPLIKLLDDY